MVQLPSGSSVYGRHRLTLFRFYTWFSCHHVEKEILLVILGGIFVAEAVSVILQVGSFKLTGKRIFKMAPLHHHFELSGWSEEKVVIRFWIIGIILAIITLSTLKIQ